MEGEVLTGFGDRALVTGTIANGGVGDFSPLHLFKGTMLVLYMFDLSLERHLVKSGATKDEIFQGCR